MKSFKILNSKKIQLLILMSLVVTLTLGVYIYSGKEINLEVDGNKTSTVSYSKTVGELLQKEEVDFQEGAYINLPLDTKIEDSLDIIIINPKTYMIKEKENVKKVSSIYETVDEILKDQDIELGKYDYTLPGSTERIKENDTIEIFRVKKDIVVRKTKIPFVKKQENTSTLYKGQKKLKQAGVDGELETHKEKVYVNGELKKSTVIKEKMNVKKVDRIVLVGTKPKPIPKPVVKAPVNKSVKTTAKRSTSSKTPSRSSSGRVANTVVMQATAYDLSYESNGKRPGDKYYGITASGMKAGPGVVAVDPRVIPLGTKLYIESMDGWPDYGYAVAGDTGGAIKGNKIDLFYHSSKTVRQFGRRNVRVTILR